MAAGKYQAGDKVTCRYRNAAERVYYGDMFDATIVAKGGRRDFVVRRADTGVEVSVWRAEIVTQRGVKPTIERTVIAYRKEKLTEGDNGDG